MAGTDRTESLNGTEMPVPGEGEALSNSDAELVARTIAGDEEALKLLIGRHAPALMGFLRGKTPTPQDAEDLFQESVVSAYRNLGALRQPENFGGWFLKIARRQVADFHRSRAGKREAWPEMATANAVSGPKLMGSVQDPGASVRSIETHEAVLACLTALPEKYRLVLYMRLVSEREPQEIASVLGLKESTVRMRLMRGMQRLKKRLTAQGFQP